MPHAGARLRPMTALPRCRSHRWCTAASGRRTETGPPRPALWPPRAPIANHAPSLDKLALPAVGARLDSNNLTEVVQNARSPRDRSQDAPHAGAGGVTLELHGHGGWRLPARGVRTRGRDLEAKPQSHSSALVYLRPSWYARFAGMGRFPTELRAAPSGHHGCSSQGKAEADGNGIQVTPKPADGRVSSIRRWHGQPEVSSLRANGRRLRPRGNFAPRLALRLPQWKLTKSLKIR